MKVCNPPAPLPRIGLCRHNLHHRDANEVLLMLYFNIILSNLWQELCEKGGVSVVEGFVGSPGGFSVTEGVFKDGL